MNHNRMNAISARGEIPAHDTAAMNPRTGTVALPSSSPVTNGQLAILGILATAGMLFAGFASAYLVRREGADWNREALPTILIFTTLTLLISSGTLEIARSAIKSGDRSVALLWAGTTTFLGLAFLAGQFDAWQQLAARGLYLPSGPYSAFVYVLTAVHGLHLLGGIVGLSYLLWRLARSERVEQVADVVRNCATYWHFVGGVWLLLYLLLRLY
jgi:cytochrome c oxidase subunit III